MIFMNIHDIQEGLSPDVFLLTFLQRPNFHLADYLFLFWMPFKKLCGMYSSNFFTLTTMQKVPDHQFQEWQTASRINMLILLSIRMLCWIHRCCGKNYENCVTIFYATSSFRICMFRFLRSNASDSACGQNP